MITIDILDRSYVKKLFNSLSSGYKSSTVTDNADGSKTLIINFVNGDKADITFKPVKGDKGETGTSVQDIKIKEISGVRHLIVTLDDGTEIDVGVLPNEQYDDTAIKADITDLQADMTTTKTDIADIKASMTNTQTDVTNLKADITTAKDDIDNLESDVEELQDKEIDTVTYANSKLTLTSKDGTAKEVTIQPKLVNLADVDITNPSGGDVVTYSASTGKFTTGQVSTTDQYVKMTATDSNAGYLADLIDDDTIKNNSGKLEVEKIKGQTITVDELNTLLGMDTNVKDTLNALSSGGMVFKDVVATYADLPNSAVNGFVYIVNADETDNGNRNAYIYSDDHAGFVLVGTSGLEVRDFTINPINLESEVVGVLPKDKMETTDLVDKTKDVINTLSYPIPTEDLEKIPNLEVLKQINTEVINALNGKMNKGDIVDNLTDNSTDKPLSANQGNVLDNKISKKIDKDKIVTTLDSTVTDEQVPSAKSVYDNTDNISDTRFENNPPSYYVNNYRHHVVREMKLTTAIGINNLETGLVTLLTYANWYDITAPIYQMVVHHKQILIRNSIDEDTWGKWRKLYTTSVEDVPLTYITFTSTTNYKQSINLSLNYTVINGICYVSGGITCVTPTSSNTQTFTLPKPKILYPYYKTIGVDSNVDDTNTVIILIKKNGELNLRKGVAGGEYRCTFSYPVSES